MSVAGKEKAKAAGGGRRPVELVSPAGSADAGYAAFRYGADAVYAGLRRFSGPASSPENLSLEELDELTAYAHALEPPRRVYVALNTLVLDHELADVVEALGAVAEIGVDAAVVRDLGVARIARTHFPGLRLHASTQTAAHSAEGVAALARMGLARVILSRELCLEEIRECASVPGVEVEVFVHGALCYSYGGLCLFSSHALGRSGNRGRCAQPCRVAFMVTGAAEGVPEGARLPFSMRDLALGGRLDSLREAGVAALKIEGRKKGALYVATVTDYYRRLLDGALPPEERARAEADMKTVFSRPWTELWIDSAPGDRKGKAVTDPEFKGHRGAHLGEAEAVVMHGAEERAFLRFRTSRRLELHDGLQVDAPGLDRPFGFSVERVRLSPATRRRRMRDVFEAPAGSTVEVELPEEYPLIPPGAPVYCSSSQEVKQRFRHSRPAPGRFRVRRPADVVVEFFQGGIAAAARAEPCREGAPPVEARAELEAGLERARDAAKTEARARAAFEKLGGTPFALGRFELRNPEALSAPASALKRLRREVVAALKERLAGANAAHLKGIKLEVAGPHPESPRERRGRGALRWSVKTDRLATLAAFGPGDLRGAEEVEEVIVDVSRESPEALEEGLRDLASRAGPERIRLALPAITRSWEAGELRARVARLRGAGWSRWEAANVSAWGFLGAGGAARAEGLDVSADWSVYVTNREAARAVLGMGATRVTLSPEDGLANMRGLFAEFGGRAAVVVYQDTPLLMSETCALASLTGECPGPGECGFRVIEMVSSFGDRLLVLNDRCRTVVIHRDPFCLSERLDDLAAAGAEHVRVDFVWRDYSAGDAVERWRAVRAGRPVHGARTANFERGMA